MENVELEPKRFLNNGVDRRELADYIALNNVSLAVSEILEILQGGYVPPAGKVEVTLISPEGDNSIYDFGTKAIKVNEGAKLTPASAGEDYILTGYYTDESLTTPFDYEATPITAPVTLYVTGNAMRLSSSYSKRLNGQENNMTEVHFVLAGEEPEGEPTATWDASEGSTGAVTAKMYEGGATYFVAREGATHIWAPIVPNLLSSCSALTAINGFKNLYGVKEINQGFAYSSAVTDLGDISDLDTSEVTTMYQMFARTGLPSKLDLSKWDVSKCMTFKFMFGEVSSQCEVNAQGWTIADGAVLTQAFMGKYQGSSSLKSIDASNWHFEGSGLDGRVLFGQQATLTSVNLTGWDFSKFRNVNDMFFQDYALEEVILEEGAYFNFENLTKVDSTDGVYRFMQDCYKLNKFHNTGNDAIDHTLTITLPNIVGLNNTQALRNVAVKADTPIYIDIDIAENAYEAAGSDNIQLVTTGSALIDNCNVKQIKIFGNYNDKWEGSTLLPAHSNLLVNASTASTYTTFNIADSVTLSGTVYSLQTEAVIMDRYIPTTGKPFRPHATNSLKWVLVSPIITPEQAPLLLAGSLSNSEMSLRGYYNGGVWEANKVPTIANYVTIATPDQRGYLTTSAEYIIPSEEDPTVIGGTLTEFNEAVKAGNLSKFPIGTEISDTYGNEEAPLIVAEYLDSSNNTAYGGAEGGILMRKYVAAGTTQWNTSTSNSYNLSTVYDYINGSYYEGCSDDLKTIISDITVPYNDVSTKTIEEVSGKVFIPSTDEISLPSATTTVGIRFTYWSAALATSTSSNAPNRIGYNVAGDKKTWWTRTAGNTGTSDAGKAYLVTTSGTTQYNSKTLATPTVRPFFFVSKNA